MLRSLILAAALIAVPAAAKPSQTQEDKLAKELAGRVAGKPTNCIYQRDIRSVRIYDRTALVYEMNDNTYYLNRPRSGAEFLTWNDVLVTDTHSPQLCSIDIVRLVDNSSHMSSGSVGLGDFVPYTKVKSTN